jgi:hypothetical protein
MKWMELFILHNGCVVFHRPLYPFSCSAWERTPPLSEHATHISNSINSNECAKPDFHKYIMFYSLPKIKSRLRIKAIERDTRLTDVCQNISPRDIASGFDDVASTQGHLPRKSEALIIPYIQACFRPETAVEFQWQDDQRHHLTISPANEVRLWYWFLFAIKSLGSQCKKLAKYRQNITNNPVIHSRIDGTMQNICNVMFLLESLVHSSNAFWHLCHNRSVVEAMGVRSSPCLHYVIR